ncbi:hypothetical protein JL722_5980 [Aureococcus anophagefferens]|nr:hypothetical protein JL722_5980 [Aureococcus anophagefferens]
MSGGITYGAPAPRTEPELRVRGPPALGSAATSRLGSADGGASRSAPGSREGGASSREEISAWQAEQSLSPEQELEVLKAILLREGCLKRLEKVINDWLSSGNTKSAPSGLSDLWDLIRMSTVEVVETVDKWRLAVAGEGGEDGAKPPFLWNGVNYLLKIPSDLDDLDMLGAIRRWAGFTLKRNPFLLPLPLDHRALAIAGGTSNLTHIGGPDSDDDDELAGSGDDGDGAVIPQDRKVRKGPYKTAVINDPALIPSLREDTGQRHSDGPAALEGGTPKSSAGKKRRGDGPLRPVVGEGDLARVRAAELALLAEEDLGGRMERDAEGRLVPALLAERETFQKQLNVDRGRPLSQGAHAPPGIAPFAELSGSGHAPPDESEDLAEAGARFAARGKYAMSGEGQDANAPFDRETGGKARAMRNGGILGPLQTAVTMGRRRAPTKRSKGAALDADIGRLKREANRLERTSARARTGGAPPSSSASGACSRPARCTREDERVAQTLEDNSATQLTRMVRGKLARLYALRLRRIYTRASTIIEAGCRGRLARVFARRERVMKRAAVNIQRISRGTMARAFFAKKLLASNQYSATVKLQTMVRSYHARRRVRRRRDLRVKALQAAEAVGVRKLFAQDLRELATAIQDAQGKDFDPADSGGAVVTEYSPIGVKHTMGVERADLSWTGAVKVLRRGHWLLRRLRSLAAGPASVPPRLLTLPRASLELFEAYGSDPTMTVDAMARVPAGSKACMQLLDFVISLKRVYTLQSDFFEDLGGDEMTPNWLVRRRVGAARRRQLQAVRIVDLHDVEHCQGALRKKKAEGKKFPVEHLCLNVARGRLALSDDELNAQDAAEAAHTMRDVVRVAEETQEKVEACQRAKRAVEAADADLDEAATDARRRGSTAVLSRLPKLRDVAAEARVAEREARARLAAARRNASMAAKRRKTVVVELPPEVKYRAVACGESRAAERLTAEMNKAWFRERGGEAHVRRLAAIVPRRGPSAALKPTDEELAEDVREDEYCAVEELLLKGRFVPSAFLPMLEAERRKEATRRAEAASQALAAEKGVIVEQKKFVEGEEDLVEPRTGAKEPWEESPKPRPRPLLVLVARDLPEIAKRKICDRLTMELSGLFVRVASKLPQGIDPAAFQAPLSLGKSVLAEVDAGLSHDARIMFIDALAFCKAALYPTPHVVLVLGDPRNRRGPSAPAPPEHYGVGVLDLQEMADASLKKDLQDAAEQLVSLTTTEALENMAEWAVLDRPPSSGHALAMEAAIVLLTRSKKFRGPDKTVTAVSWLAARRLLVRPVELVAKLRDFDPATLPPQTLFVLKEYVNSPDWPRGDAIISAGDYLAKHGGAAPVVSRRDPPDLVGHVITVSDGHSAAEEESEAANRGQRAAFARLLEAVLEDCRSFRAAAKLATTRIALDDGTIPPDAIYNVNVYHDCGRVFFSAYDSSRSTALVESVHERDVDKLLAPNSIEHRAHAAKMPPRSLAEMYSRLVQLLVVNRGTAQALTSKADPAKADTVLHRIVKPRVRVQQKVTPPRLMCRRKLNRLLRETRRISGYFVTITVYEEARGELRIHAYLPERSASLEYAVTTRVLHAMSTNADNTVAELDALESHVADRMLPFVADRIEVVPSRAAAEDMDCLPFFRAVAADSRGGAARNAGFKLRMRTCKGPGRRLFRTYRKVSGLRLLISCDETGAADARLLRIRLYDPVSAEVREVRLATTHRAVILGSAATDWRSWRDNLVKRLSLKRKRLARALEDANAAVTAGAVLDADGVSFDATIHSKACHIEKRLTRIRVELLGGSGEGLLVKAFDTATKRDPSYSQAEVVVSKERLISLWHLPDATENPVRAMLGGDAATRKRGLGLLISGLARDRDTGAVILASNQRLRARKRASSPNRRLSRVERAAQSESAFHRRFDGPPSAFAAGRVAAPPPEDGSTASFVRLQRQAPVVKFEHALRPMVKDKDGEYGDADLVVAPPPAPADDAAPAPAPSPAPADVLVVEEAAPEIVEETITDLRLVYQQGVRTSIKTLREPPPPGSAVDDDGNVRELVYVKVYEAYTSGVAVRQLRFEVYRHSTSAAEVCVVEGLKLLREVLGPDAQHMLAQEREEEMLQYIVAERIVLHEGVWDGDEDRFLKMGDRFTPRFKTDRLFDATKKVTPLDRGGDDDDAANAKKNFDQGRMARGTKVLRHAQEIDGVLVHVTAFELPLTPPPDPEAALSPPTEADAAKAPGGLADGGAVPAPAPAPGDDAVLADEPPVVSDGLRAAAGMPVDDGPENPERGFGQPHFTPLPSLRFVCWNPRAKHASIFLVPPEASAEVLAEEDRDQPEHGILAKQTKPSSCPGAAARARPYSTARPEPVDLEEERPGAPEGTKGEKRRRRLRYDKEPREPADRVNDRRRRIFRVSTRMSGVECVVSVFHAANTANDLDMNVYVPRIKRSAEVRVTQLDQQKCLGRPCLEHEEGEPRKAAIDWLIRHLKLHDIPDFEDLQKDPRPMIVDDELAGTAEEAKKPEPMSLTLETNPAKPWLSAYHSLQTDLRAETEPGTGRPHGIPMTFIPATTTGDLVLRRGMALPRGGECIVTVTTRAPDEDPAHGLVIHAYDPVTSYTAKLHVGAREILKLCAFDKERMMGDLVKASVNRYVLKRLVIEPSPIGGLKLTIARIPRKLRDAGVVDHFYAADPAPPPLPADGDPDKPRYAYACEDPDHPDYAGPWRGSDVVEPDPSAPPTPDLRTTYDHTTPTPDPSRPATAASEAMSLSDNIKTTPPDKRFPTQNQANHCWNRAAAASDRYNEWVLCLKKTDGDEDACKPMRQFALSICPDDWYNKWDEEREEGTFSGIKFSA